MSAVPNLRTTEEIRKMLDAPHTVKMDFKKMRGLVQERNELYKALVIAEEALTNFYGGEADDSSVMEHIRKTLKNAGRV